MNKNQNELKEKERKLLSLNWDVYRWAPNGVKCKLPVKIFIIHKTAETDTPIEFGFSKMRAWCQRSNKKMVLELTKNATLVIPQHQILSELSGPRI